MTTPPSLHAIFTTSHTASINVQGLVRTTGLDVRRPSQLARSRRCIWASRQRWLQAACSMMATAQVAKSATFPISGRSPATCAPVASETGRLTNTLCKFVWIHDPERQAKKVSSVSSPPMSGSQWTLKTCLVIIAFPKNF
eukprot:2296489-Amphidinium_carterae.1